MRTYKFRIYPTKRQKTLLNAKLEICRKVYNRCLEYKENQYLTHKKHVGEFDMNSKICEWRNSETWMQNCEITFLHDVSRRVDKAFKGFFRRLKEKNGKAGFPRFKKEQYTSISNPRFTFRERDGKVRLTNDIGWMKTVIHRQFPKMPTGYTLSKNQCGEWFVCMWFENVEPIHPALDKSLNVGLDMGSANFFTDSLGNNEASPHFLKVASKELAKAQRKGRKDVAAKIHKKVANRRADWLHKLSNRLVKNYDLIFTEDLNMRKLNAGTFKNVRKSLLDSAWGRFAGMLSYKAASAGKIYGKVNPAYTSQECHQCGKINELSLADRVMKCSCGYVSDRDTNAARNILRRGLASLAQA